MAPGSSKYVDARLDRLTEENSLLKRDLEKLKECLAEMKAEMDSLQFVVSENIERREVVETNLAAVNAKCSELETNLSSVNSLCSTVVTTQSKIQKAVEVQAQYSRVSTLLLSGNAIPPYRAEEDTRSGVLHLIKEYLGITIHPLAISACHRLKNKRTILLRFMNLAERDAVYRKRTRPLKRGLAIHESLTAERLEVVKMLKDLFYPREQSPLETYYTNRGRIFMRPRGCSGALELEVGATRERILSLCRGRAPGVALAAVSGADRGLPGTNSGRPGSVAPLSTSVGGSAPGSGPPASPGDVAGPGTPCHSGVGAGGVAVSGAASDTGESGVAACGGAPAAVVGDAPHPAAPDPPGGGGDAVLVVPHNGRLHSWAPVTGRGNPATGKPDGAPATLGSGASPSGTHDPPSGGLPPDAVPSGLPQETSGSAVGDVVPDPGVAPASHRAPGTPDTYRAVPCVATGDTGASAPPGAGRSRSGRCVNPPPHKYS